MKKIVLGLLAGFLTFFTAYFISAFTLDLSKNYSLWGFGALLGFILIFTSATLYFRKFSAFLPPKVIIFLSVFGVILFTFLSAPSIRFSTKVLPSTLCYLLGILAAIFFNTSAVRKRYLYTFLLFAFPLVLNLNLYTSWVHLIEFGNISGNVGTAKTIPFEVQDESGNTVTSTSLKGKIVLIDFWFISCGPCWKKFPLLQEIHEKYKDHPLVELYAINRPMSSDKPGQSFQSIKDKGYTFQVLQGSQKIMDDFDIYVYPTVVILDQNGRIAFMGTLEKAEESLQKLLENLPK